MSDVSGIPTAFPQRGLISKLPPSTPSFGGIDSTVVVAIVLVVLVVGLIFVEAERCWMRPCRDVYRSLWLFRS